MVRLLFATTNEGKFLEFARTMHAYLPTLKIVSLQSMWGTLPSECKEDGTTFEQNAEQKARYYHGLLKDPAEVIVVAEDSGMEIEALNGAPGVHSRRWNGTSMTDEQIITYCLKQMEGKKNRRAAYVSSYFVILPDGRTFSVTEQSSGEILDTPQKASMMNGLPFRSLFYVPSLGKMFHEVRELPASQRIGYELGQEVAARRIAEYIA